MKSKFNKAERPSADCMVTLVNRSRDVIRKLRKIVGVIEIL